MSAEKKKMTRTKSQQTRRTFLKGAGVVMTAALADQFLLAKEAQAQNKQVLMNTWGGVLTEAENEAFYKPFTKATGIPVKPVTPVSYAKWKAQVTSGQYEWDITTLNQAQWGRAEQEGLVEPIDWTIIDKSKLWDGAVYANGIGFTTLSNNLCYRKDKFPNGGPKNWADFWDVKKFPGNRSFNAGDAITSVLAALQADGVAKDKLYPPDLDRAFKKLDELKPHIKVFWTQGTQSQQLLRDGEVDMMMIWNARATDLQKQGVPVELVWEGNMMLITNIGVAKGAPDIKASWEYIKQSIQPERLADYAQRLPYGPANPEAFKFIPENVAKDLPTYPANLAVGVRIDPAWGVNYAKLEERYAQWMAS